MSVFGEDAVSRNGRKVSYLPSMETSYTIWYKHHYVSINKYQARPGQTRDGLQIQFVALFPKYSRIIIVIHRILARDQSILNDILEEAKQLHNAAQEYHISLYIADK